MSANEVLSRQRFLGVTSAAMLLVLLGVGTPSSAASQIPNSFFYRGPLPGSQGAFSPFAAVLHSGFYNFQIDNRGDDPFAVSYGLGFRNVILNLINPIGAIADYGWGRFLTSEVLPNLKRESGQWVPNYFGHVLGEGLVFRYNYEWYRYHRVPHPKLMAAVSLVAGAMLNEVVENGTYQGTNVDPVADFYIFNPLGMLLFSSDGAARFFRAHLGMAYWPLQALYDPAMGVLDNVGYRTVFRWHPRAGRLGIFATYGTQALLGLSYRSPWGITISGGAGACAVELHPVPDPAGSRTITATMGPAAGIFADRDGSLLASLVVAPDKAEAVTLNVFPGLLGPEGFRPGFVIQWGDSVGVRFGLTVAQFPVGFGVRTKR